MDRAALSEARARVAPLLEGKDGDPGRSAADNRLFVEAVLWMARVGAPWRDLPTQFGSWNSVFRRFRRWATKGVFERLFAALSGEPDFEYVMVDGTIVRAHQHAMGAKGRSGPGATACEAGWGGARRGLRVRPSGVRVAA